MDLDCLARELILHSVSNEEPVYRGIRQMHCREQGREAGRSLRDCYRNAHSRGWKNPHLGSQRTIPQGLSSCLTLSCRCSSEDIRPMSLSKAGPGQEKEKHMGIRVQHHLIQGFMLYLLEGGITQMVRRWVIPGGAVSCLFVQASPLPTMNISV